MSEMGQPGGIDERLIQEAIASDRQAAELKKIGAHEVVKRHDDGDLTIKDSFGQLYVITTEGQTFYEGDTLVSGLHCCVAPKWKSFIPQIEELITSQKLPPDLRDKLNELYNLVRELPECKVPEAPHA